MDLKYIIIEKDFPILFTGAQQHRNIAPHEQITSAGFFSVDADGVVHVYGESVSLQLSPFAEDAELIQDIFFPLTE